MYTEQDVEKMLGINSTGATKVAPVTSYKSGKRYTEQDVINMLNEAKRSAVNTNGFTDTSSVKNDIGAFESIQNEDLAPQQNKEQKEVAIKWWPTKEDREKAAPKYEEAFKQLNPFANADARGRELAYQTNKTQVKSDMELRFEEYRNPPKPSESENKKLNFFEGIGYLGESLASGVGTGTEGLAKSAVDMGAYMAMADLNNANNNLEMSKAIYNFFGNKDVVKNIEKIQDVNTEVKNVLPTAAAKMRPQIFTEYAQNVQNRYGQQSGILKGFGDIANGVGGMAPAVVSNVIVPGSGLVVMFSSSAGNAADEARKAGADENTAFAYGILTGAVDVATEKLFGGIPGLNEGAFNTKALGNIAKSETGQKLVKTVVDMFGEGAEEYLSSVAGAYLEKMYNDNGKNVTETFILAQPEAFYAGFIGAITSGVMQGGNAALQYNKPTNRVHDTTVVTESDAQNEVVKPKSMEQIVQEYGKSTDQSVVDYIAKVKNEPNTKQWLELGTMNEKSGKEVAGLVGFDATGYKVALSPDAVRHIENRHGEKGKADHSMADPKELARIKYVLQNYDMVETDGVKNSTFRNSDNTYADAVVYSKRVNGTYYVVEAVPNNKIKTLQIVSAYKTKATGMVPTHALSPVETSYNASPLPVNTNISQANKGVKQQASKINTKPLTQADLVKSAYEAKVKQQAKTKAETTPIDEPSTVNYTEDIIKSAYEAKLNQNQEQTVVSKEASGAKTGTVWDDIKSTQPNIEGTNIPKSFELNAGGKQYWVNPNGTKHIAEYATRTLSHGQKITEQQLLTSLKGAVSEAATKGYTYNVPIRVGNWELIFSPARQAGQLPVVKHALYIIGRISDEN